MSKVKLILMEGHGTETSPYISGTTEVLTTDITLKDNQHIQAVCEYDFDEDEQGERQVSDNIDPVIYIGAINNLIGKVLTLVDATFSDEVQRKAARGMFMDTVWNWYQVPDSVMEAWRKDKYPEYDKAFDKVNEDRSVK
jgi:hypothetical protein